MLTVLQESEKHDISKKYLLCSKPLRLGCKCFIDKTQSSDQIVEFYFAHRSFLLLGKVSENSTAIKKKTRMDYFSMNGNDEEKEGNIKGEEEVHKPITINTAPEVTLIKVNTSFHVTT
jgi:hypothetical protein